ncbi:MAG: ABC transporter substrate-binding protein [Gammaproteobacteria bacterium]
MVQDRSRSISLGMSLLSFAKRARGLLVAVLAWGLIGVGPAAQANGPLRIALNDLPGKGMLPILVGIEHARERGLDIQVSYLNSENIVVQALRGGLADVGMGTPYQLVQNNGIALRMFYQLSKLAFFPVVDTRYYASWKELDGADMYAHGPGSGTEALVNILAKRNGIRYRTLHYLPGSGTRAQAMLEGRIKATVLDAERTQLLVNAAGGYFKALPLGDVSATDEALFAYETVIRSRRADIETLVSAFLGVWRRMNADPAWLEAERQRLGLLPRLDGEAAAGIVPYITGLVEAGAFAGDGGAEGVVARDFRFYTDAGTLTGDPADLREEDFWDLEPLRAVIARESARSGD